MTIISTSRGALAPSEFRVGGVLAGSFGILSQSFAKFFLLTAITGTPIIVVVALGVGLIIEPAYRGTGQIRSIVPPVIGVLVLWVTLYFFGQLVSVHAAFQSRRGRQFRIGQSLRRGIARFLPAVTLAICMLVAIGASLFLLIVPGLFAATLFYVALPACVLERRGPFESLGRSIALTKRHRWQIFGISAVVALICVIGRALLRFAAFRFGGIALVFFTFAWFGLIGAFQAIVAAVVYHDLRMLKEGGDFEQIASVFD
jgi:hypothetical protein